jgi:hypothetical protein
MYTSYPCLFLGVGCWNGQIYGQVDPGYEIVKDTLARLIREGSDTAASFTVFG